jgi:tryptophan halogenase
MLKCVVVGGGTAGWLSALYAQKHIPYSDVTVIASSDIGILGAGEGTTPHILPFLKEIDIPVADIIKHARGTFKNGIRFVNWNGDDKNYIHSFWDHYDSSNKLHFDDIVPLYIDCVANDKNCDEVSLSHYLCNENKVKIKKETNEVCGDYALHFDANLLAKYLESVALSRGIKLIDDEVITINNNSTGNIKSFDLKSGLNVEADFVFDCTGFQRLIIGKHYNTKWNSYKDTLPVNRAMPFFIEHDDTNVPPYTDAIAMKYGWMWKIPVQGRFGCGYVFDSSMVTDEEIVEELTEYLGYKPTIPRVFSFEAGTYEKMWVKNCIAVGLSSGFIEPLEATSIWVSINILKNAVSKASNLITQNPDAVTACNKNFRDLNEDILGFLYFHYMSKRSDSEFWNTFTIKNKMPMLIENLTDISKKTFPKKYDFTYLFASLGPRTLQPFNYISYYQVGSGIRFFDKRISQRELENYDPTKCLTKTKAVEVINNTSRDVYYHDDYIKMLKNG